MGYIKRILKIIYLLAIILLISQKGSGDSSLDKFIKDIKDIKPAKFERTGEKYRVKPGDNIWHILIEIYNISPNRYRDYLDSIKSVNPGIIDINKISPGELITIPDIPLRNKITLEKKLSFLYKKDYFEPSKDKIFEFFSKIDEDIDFQSISIPIFENGEIKINGEIFPTVKVRGRKIIILDFDDTISPSLKEIIEKYLKDSKVVKVRGSMDDFISSILNIAGYYSVREKDRIILGDEAKMILNCDFIVEKNADSVMGSKIYIINFIRDGSSYLPKNLIDYLEDKELNVIEIKGKDYEIKKNSSSNGVIILLDNLGSKDLVIKLLDIIGERYDKDIIIDVTKSLLNGIKITIKSDILLKRDGKTYIISFSNIPEDISEFIEEYGFKIIYIDKNYEFKDMISKIYDGIGYKYKYGSYILPEIAQLYNRIGIEIPGAYISNSNKIPSYLKGHLSFPPDRDSFLITNAKLDNSIKNIIKEGGFEIKE